MSYSGNPSLSADVKERILGTFQQTLDLAREGSRQEALLGCDFVLRLDPQFEPARRLQEKLKGGSGPLSAADLAQFAPGQGGPSEDPFSALDALGVDLPDLPLVTGGGGDLRGEFSELMKARRFRELVDRAGQAQAAVSSDPELQRLASEAQERLEAEPYLAKFLGAASEALAAGRLDDVKKSLAKARALEPQHPELVRLEGALAASAGGAPAVPVASAAPVAIPVEQDPLASFFGSAEPESDRRIKELLDEGQAAFDSGDPQGAIDSWSRIFLIDIDHQEAARRIDSARRVKAETERQVEEIFHEGVGHLETGDVESAKRSFERVLELEPTYFAAQEYLQQLAAGTVPTPRPVAPRETFHEPVAAAQELPAGGEELSQEILVPPEPGASGKKGAVRSDLRPTKVAVAREGRGKVLLLGLGGLVLAAVIVGGWFLYQRWDSLFPNSDADSAKQATGEDTLARAQKLHQSGKGPIAKAILKRIQPSDPLYEKAQKVLAEWEAAEGGAKEATSATSDSATDEASLRRASYLAAARAAASESRYLDSLRYATLADSIAKLEGGDAALIPEARQQLAPIIKSVDLFLQHEWELGLRDLWQLRDIRPNDRDVKQLLVDSYYNLGVRELQRSDPAKAAESFREALNLAPDDAMARRAMSLAQSYRDRDKDLLYRIFVKYLPTR